MSNAFDELGTHTRHLLYMSGRSGIVYNYSRVSDEESAKWYEETIQTEWTEDDGTEITFRINTESMSVVQGPAGRDREADAMIVVDPNQADFSAGLGTDERSSEIVDPRDNVRYRVEDVINDHGGVLTLDCSMLDDPASDPPQ